MVSTRLYGRLGNQCFQVAAAIAHARKMETHWAIPRVTNDARIWPNYLLHTVPRENITMYSTRNLYDELRHCYDPLPTTHDVTINGYFQSEKYWPTYEEKYEIGTALRFHSRAYEHDAEGMGYIAIHVRRGDYLQYSDQFPTLDYKYYLDAMAYMSENTLCHKFKFYSDDIEYCKKTFGHLSDWNFSYSNTKDPLTDMRDMYNACGFILANSTFSLFPALLRLDNPITIAPAENRWYGPANKHLETFDLMPERFIKI